MASSEKLEFEQMEHVMIKKGEAFTLIRREKKMTTGYEILEILSCVIHDLPYFGFN